jgi:hypothetical protein
MPHWRKPHDIAGAVPTPSARSAIASLHLDRLDVVHAGEDTFSLGPRLRALAFRRLLNDLSPLR